MDLSAVPVAQQLSHLPVMAGPSHGGGRAGRWFRSSARASPRGPAESWWTSVRRRRPRCATAAGARRQRSEGARRDRTRWAPPAGTHPVRGPGPVAPPDVLTGRRSSAAVHKEERCFPEVLNCA
ncbi:hypothetical protein ABZY02_16845 [Streptomyces sp. NPDC006649]|uniref:hypothetical protein n=1 Tax=Streptomyces sp. NPDC006649 TaxID=3156896 RepID=UPI0033B6F0FB